MTRSHLSTLSKGTLGVPFLRKEHANSIELLKRVSFRFVSIAIPFKKERNRANVEEFLNAHQLEYTTSEKGCTLKYCPFCNKPHNNEPTNLYRLNINN